MLDIIIILLLPFAALCCIFAEQKKEHPAWWKLLLLLMLLFIYIIILSEPSGAVRAIAPFEEFNKERLFFWNIFIEKLHETNSFSAAVEEMGTQILQVKKYITHITSSFVKTGVRLLFPGSLLALAAVVMIVLNFRKKSAPWLLTAVVAAAFLTGGAGAHYCAFGKHLERRLTSFLASQQHFLVTATESGKPFRTNREISAHLTQYLKDTPKVFGESPDRLETVFFKVPQKP